MHGREVLLEMHVDETCKVMMSWREQVPSDVAPLFQLLTD